MKKILRAIIVTLLIVSINSRHFKRHGSRNDTRNCTICKQRCLRHIHPVKNPDFVVTFVANTKFVTSNESSPQRGINEGFDSFDKIIQSFFSSFMQLLTSGMQFGQNVSKHDYEKVETTIKDANSTTLDFKLTSETTINFNNLSTFKGFNDSAENVINPQVQKKVLEFDKNKTENAPVEIFNSTEGGPINLTSNTVRLGDENIQKRHYFLSISGGIEKSTTAKITSDVMTFKEANNFYTNLLNLFDSQTERKSNLNSTKVIVNKLYKRDAHKNSNVHRVKRQNNTAESTTVTEAASNTTDYDDLPDYDDRSPAPSVVYTSNNYIFTVTTPIFVGFLLIILGLCLCFRNNGCCCRMFLTDPTKVVVAQPIAGNEPVSAVATEAQKE